MNASYILIHVYIYNLDANFINNYVSANSGIKIKHFKPYFVCQCYKRYLSHHTYIFGKSSNLNLSRVE